MAVQAHKTGNSKSVCWFTWAIKLKIRIGGYEKPHYQDRLCGKQNKFDPTMTISDRTHPQALWAEDIDAEVFRRMEVDGQLELYRGPMEA